MVKTDRYEKNTQMMMMMLVMGYGKIEIMWCFCDVSFVGYHLVDVENDVFGPTWP